MSEKQKGFNLDRIVGYYDIAKGLGEIALEFVTKRFVSEPTPNMSDHYAPTETETRTTAS